MTTVAETPGGAAAGDRIDRPAPVRPGEELDAGGLAGYLRERLPGAAADLAAGGLAIEQFPRGFSNLTYLLRLGDRRLVLRRPPFGSTVATAHDMAREHRILAALAPVYPKAPRPLLLCADPAVLGAPFYLMERVEGVILRPGALAAGAPPPPERMAAVAGALIATLAELHAVDWRAAGLGDLGRPEGYVERQVEGWAARWRRAAAGLGGEGDLPEMERVAAWLAEHRPPESGAALIHNDFKHDNLVLAPGDWSKVLAVLDWEMATVGDPLMDLGTTLGYWVEAGDPPEMRALDLSPSALPGSPGRAEVVERYARATGRDPGGVVFYYAYGLFKIAVIAQQIYARFRAGLTRDPRFANLHLGVAACARTAAQAIDRRRIDRLFDV
jgi:aminoglycoside phosphotransferase (APT) family kinase protein